MTRGTAATSSGRPGHACVYGFRRTSPSSLDDSRWPPENLASIWRNWTIATLESTITVTEDGGYRVALDDADGLTSEGMEYFIRVMDDRPPDVRIAPSGRRSAASRRWKRSRSKHAPTMITGSRASSWSTRWRAARRRWCRSRRVAGTNMARIGSRLLAAEDLGVKPGDVDRATTRGRATLPAASRSTLSRERDLLSRGEAVQRGVPRSAQSQAMAAATGDSSSKA